MRLTRAKTITILRAGAYKENKMAKSTKTTAKKTLTKEEQEKKLNEILEKVKEPIFLESPLQYKAGEVVIAKLPQEERDQIMFKFITKMCASLDLVALTLNDMLLLQMEQCRKLGIDASKIIDKSVVQFNEEK